MKLKRRRSARTLLTGLIVLFVLWQIWQKVHIVLWIHIPWWGLILAALVVIVILDLLLDQFLKDS